MLICSIITVLYVTDYPVATTYTTHPITLKTLIQNLKAEERIQFWQDAWKMQKDSSLIGWILGNGIGSFRVLFRKYSVPQYSHFIFPHNFFLEVLYENGIVGFVLIFGGLGFLFSTAMIKAKKVVNKQRSILLRCMIILFLMWFIYCGLVFPFYSNYTLIPLAFILGTLLVMVGRMPRDEVLQHNNRG